MKTEDTQINMIQKNSMIKLGLNKMIEVREIGVIIPIILAVILFGSINPDFYSFENVVNILSNSSFVFITAIGMTYVLIAAGLDISVGSQMACGGLFVGIAMTLGVPFWLAIPIGIIGGILMGLLNGFFIEVIGVPALIATLGTTYLFRGVINVSMQGEPIYPLPDAFEVIGQGKLLGIPYVVFIAIIFGIIGAAILKYTTFGRMIYAVGGNEETSRLSGIPVKKIRFYAYIIVSVLAAITGIIYASKFGSVQPNLGIGFELSVIAAVIIGGTSLFGGAGTMTGSLLGAIFLNLVTNGMSMIHVNIYWQPIVIGIIIILAVALDQVRIRLKK